MIYLDHNATTPPAPEVIEAMTAALRDAWANPSSSHRAGQAARRRVELARADVAALVGAAPADIHFTSGGTEADNLAIRGTLRRTRPEGRTLVLAAPTEHAAVRDTVRFVAAEGGEARWIEVDAHGRPRPDHVRDLLEREGARVALVSVMWANNETGVVNDVPAIAAIARDAGVPIHVDAVQWVGKMPTDLRETPIDLLALAAHKLRGPKGVGALVVRPGTRLQPEIHGGGQETGLRGGTENVPGIVGLGAAAALARTWLAGDGPARAAALRDRLQAGLLETFPGAVVHGADVPRLWSTLSIALPGVSGELMLQALSERGVCAASGAACHSGAVEPSGVLVAMGLAPSVAASTIRLSVGSETTEAEVDAALETIRAVGLALAGTADVID